MRTTGFGFVIGRETKTKSESVLLFFIITGSDLIIPGLVANGTAKTCCLGLILVLF